MQRDECRMENEDEDFCCILHSSFITHHFRFMRPKRSSRRLEIQADGFAGS
jgi:hypothetical protein